MLKENWSKFVDNTRSDGGNIEAGKSNSWRKSRKIQIPINFSLIIAIGFLVLVTFLIISLGGREIKSGHEIQRSDGNRNRSRIVKFCKSYECNQTARIIRAKMNMVMDPCDNFYEV